MTKTGLIRYEAAIAALAKVAFEATYQQAIGRYARLLEFDPSGVRGLGLSLAPAPRRASHEVLC